MMHKARFKVIEDWRDLAPLYMDLEPTKYGRDFSVDWVSHWTIWSGMVLEVYTNTTAYPSQWDFRGVVRLGEEGRNGTGSIIYKLHYLFQKHSSMALPGYSHGCKFRRPQDPALYMDCMATDFGRQILEMDEIPDWWWSTLEDIDWEKDWCVEHTL